MNDANAANSSMRMPRMRARLIRTAGGFTLVELMVVIAIITIITSVILFNTSRFNSSILLRSLAYEVGLSIRQAQLYGVATRAVSTSGTNDPFASSYGIYLDNTNPGSPIIGTVGASYPLFADTYPPGAPDGRYTPGPGGDKLIDTFTLSNGFVISKFCVYVGTVSHCTDSTPPITWLSITFKRPNPEATILGGASSDICTQPSPPCTSASITLSSPSSPLGDTRTVTVSLLGQIVIK